MTVGNNYMVHKADAHQFAGPADVPCQFVVKAAGGEITGRVVVADSENGAVGKNSLSHDNTDIDSCLSNATMRDTYFLDQAIILIE